jgi:transcriptional regulatory protein RtcR
MNRIVISMLGTKLDQRGEKERRWQYWRPNLSIVLHDAFQVDKFILIHQQTDAALAQTTIEDIQKASPKTHCQAYSVNYDNPWDFEQVYAQLHDFAVAQSFDPEHDEIYVNISTGTHVVQICLFLLTESRYLPGRLLQSSPSKTDNRGHLQIIDLDLSRYDQLAARFQAHQHNHIELLKQGIDTRNLAFNQLIQLIEKIATASQAPMLLTGQTGVGKSKMASLIYQLKKQRGQLKGTFVEVNCATLRGDQAMSTLFGHVKGAFTGAMSARSGLLKMADHGLLFLDEIAELGMDEQAMLLRAIEDQQFFPMGSDQIVSSRFQLIVGTNKFLPDLVMQGKFREDLLARINLWTIEMPPLKARLDDIEPNIDFELMRMSQRLNRKISFNVRARTDYLTFAQSDKAIWVGNFRDLSASIQRMATLAEGGRIRSEDVALEVNRLCTQWQMSKTEVETEDLLAQILSEKALDQMDLFDQLQLTQVIRICLSAHSVSEAGRKLYAVSRDERRSVNDAHRLRMYLKKYGLTFDDIQALKA